MHTPVPQRILFLRPDAYGDLFLFEPIPRLVRHTWPQTEVAVLIREPYADAVPLLASEGVRWLTTACNPYRQGPGDTPAALDALRETVRAFAPDCVVAACAEQTWLEAAVASFLPDARQVSLGPGLTDPLERAALDAVLPVDWTAIYPEKIPVPAEEVSEWVKNLGVASALFGHEAPRWWPTATVPADAAERAAQVIADAGLRRGEFVVCAAAGTANVQIKSWPAAHYGETLAWLEREHGVRALLLGHASERAHLETVREAARRAGASPALWAGQDGEMPVVAGLLAAARFYFGNDTGALHLAAALGRPVVPVFGGGHWPRFQPVARRSLTVVQLLPCFGCGWDCYFVDAPCVRTIAPASVQRALEEFLADDATDLETIFDARDLDPGVRTLIETTTPPLRFQRADSLARLHQTRELGVLLAASEADRDARLHQVDALVSQLKGSEAESLARLQQVDELTTRFKGSETEGAARHSQITELTALLKTSETDRDARQTQIASLSTLLRTSESDRDARQTQIAELADLLRTSESDRDARQSQIEGLSALLKTSEADRDARQSQVTELGGLLKTSETDRDARQSQIAELADLLRNSETDRDARQSQIIELSTLLKTSDADRDARQTQITELTALLKASDADREARDQQISALAALLKTSETDRDARLVQVEKLTILLHESEADRAARGAQIEQLTSWLLAQNVDHDAPQAHVTELTALLPPTEAGPDAPEEEFSVKEPALETSVRTEPDASDEESLPDTSKLTAGPGSGTSLPVLPGGGGRRAKHESFHDF